MQTFMDYEMWDTTWHAPDYIKTLQDLTREPLQNFEGLNFVDWSKKNNFYVTDPGLHPLEDAHLAACKLWVDTYAQELNR